MPSVLIGNPLLSGPQQIVSGNPWSGAYRPYHGMQVALDINASGNVYIGWSGGGSGQLGTNAGVTLNSGGLLLSGGGLMDGFQVIPGGSYFVPRLALDYSGNWNVFFRHDAACSGQARLYYDVF